MSRINPPRLEGTIEVGRRRRLGFAEFGPASGRPFFWLHGTPGARRQIPQAARLAADELGLRIVGVDRPGVGSSTPHLYDSVLDFADDLADIANRLGFDEFGLIGLSGGGPYVLAASYALPDRVAVAGVLGGVAPTQGPDAAHGGLVGRFSNLGPFVRTARVPISLFLSGAVWMLRPLASPAFDLFARVSPEGDRVVFARPEIKAMFLDDLLRGSRSGIAAPIFDFILFCRPWGFSVSEITVPVRWWHGDADHMVPFAHGEHLVSLIPDAKLFARPGESHLGGLGAAEEVLGTLLEAWDAASVTAGGWAGARPSVVSGDFWGDDPHPAMTWMRQHEPVYWDEQGGVWAITKYADVKYVSRHPRLFSNAQGIRPDSPALPMMIDMDDPEHSRRRKLVSSGFTPRQVAANEPAVRAACTAIIDAVAEAGTCDFVHDIAAPLPMIMIGDALGVAPDDRTQLLTWSDDMVTALTGADREDSMQRAADAFVGFTEYITRVIADRRENPTDDLISVLVHAEVDGSRLDHDSLVHDSLLILIGGDETTRHVLSGGAYQVLRQPDLWQRLVEDPSRIPLAVEEMLRWVTPIKNMARTATQDVELRDRTLRAGDTMLLLYPSANRDEEVFDEPFRFDIERHPNEHVAFGFGTHFCLGNSLARLELKVMFEELVRRLPDIELVEEDEPPRRRANFISGYERMPVRFTPAR